MAEMIKVKRPVDGMQMIVSRKVFETSLKERGFVLAASDEKPKQQAAPVTKKKK